MPSSPAPAEPEAIRIEPGSDWRKPGKKKRVQGVKEEVFRRLIAGEEINVEDLAEETGAAASTVINGVRKFRVEIGPVLLRRDGHRTFYRISEADVRKSSAERLPALSSAPRVQKGDVPDFDSTLLVSGINRDPKTGGVFVVLYDPGSGRSWIADIRGSAG